MNEKIIIIEDDKGVRFFLEEALKGEGYKVSSYESYEDAYTDIDVGTGLIIMDIRLPGIDGLAAIDDLKIRMNVPILVITAYGTKKNAMEAVERGATDFFVKPIALDELKIVVRRTLTRRELSKEIEQRRKKTFTDSEFHGVIGISEAMKNIFKTVEKIADKNLSVLITGETGTGKEVIAGLIHRLSKRKGSLVVVNCASIPDNLLESELFGYEKGAFTGALQQKQGRFELADEGTLVLDEIGEMSPYLQAKLLRVIENKEIERLGGINKKNINVRIIATTNRNLTDGMKDGTFREDLYFRLSQMHIHIEPLRERKEDTDILIDRILFNITGTTDNVPTIDKDARQKLLEYNWPGNVRELINIIKRAAIMCEGNHITLDDLPLYLRGNYSFESLKMYSDKSLDKAISDLEKSMIVEALKKTKGQQAKAAKLLSISERSMWYRIKKYGVEISTDE
jgi:DNA-binding NtrC family response regulator